MSQRGKWPRPSLSVRFHSKYIPEPNSGCWLWLGKISRYGYGRVTLSGDRVTKEAAAHRVSVELSGRTIPDGMCALHKCDVRSCVNPDHIYIGTKADNSQDMVKRSHAKLSAEQVRAIKADTDTSTNELAERFGVGASTIRNYKTGRTWSET